MWTERQAALLKAMGVRLWSAPLAAADSVDGSALPVVDSAQSVAGVVPGPSPSASSSASSTSSPRSSAQASQHPPAHPPPAAARGLPLHPALPAQVAALDWPALQAAVAGCRACALCDSRRQTVFGAGHTQARWLVVGEAPGEQEDAAGEPFVGPAGPLLDAMLQALQLSRRADDDLTAWPAAQRVYVANTLKCRPPRNRNPEAAELAQCEPYLLRQIELLRPQLILALGRFAVQALLRSSEAIGRLRGRVHHYQGTPVIVSYHPAYLLRNPADKARAWEDLCLAAETAEAAGAAAGADPVPTPPRAGWSP